MTRTTSLSKKKWRSRRIAGVSDEVFLTTYFYDALGRVQRQVDNAGQANDYRYDSTDRLVAMADAVGPLSGATIDRRTFADGAGTVNAINDFGNVTLYTYDGVGRRVMEERLLTGEWQWRWSAHRGIVGRDQERPGGCRGSKFATR